MVGNHNQHQEKNVLKKDMTFPAVFAGVGVGEFTKIVIVAAISENHFAGYTTSSWGGTDPTKADDGDKWGGIWNKNGKCLFTSAGSLPLSADNRSIKFGPNPTQVQYDKLSVDQRAILCALVTRGHYSDNARNYLKESLKVDVNLDDIIKYAINKDFK